MTTAIILLITLCFAAVAGVVVGVVFLVTRRKEPRGFPIDPMERKE